jgi:hypothetical protein
MAYFKSMSKAAPSLAFQRDQVERAIAATTGRISNAQNRPDASLKADLKRLINLDRSLGIKTRKGPLSRYAFFEGPPPGSGFNVTYTFERAFALLLAERLLRCGLTQLRAVTRLRTIRGELDKQVRQILERPRRQAHPQLSDEQRQHLRTLRTVAGDPKAMLFLMTSGSPAADLEIYEPRFCSYPETNQELSRMAGLREPTIVIELVDLVLDLQFNLARAPAVRRGRP